MPPATLGTVCTPPDAPVVSPNPHWNPASSVVGPTSLLNENVPPGGTTTPFRRSAARAMLCAFSGTDPTYDVLLSSIMSPTYIWAPSVVLIAGATVVTGRSTAVAPAMIWVPSNWLAAATSSA